MSTDMNQVNERLWVGGMVDKVEDLAAVGITHVICCRKEHDDHAEFGATELGQKIQWLWLPQDDDGTRRDRGQVLSGIKFALDALAQPATKVYAHCAAGVNRGPTMAYAILRACGVPEAEAIAKLRYVRPQVFFFNYPSYLRSVDDAITGRPYPDLIGMPR